MTFLAVVSSPLPPTDVVCPVFFLNSATFHFHISLGYDGADGVFLVSDTDAAITEARLSNETVDKHTATL